MIPFLCPRCRTRTEMPDAAAGTTVACGSCGQPVIVPTPPAEPVAGLPVSGPPWTRVVYSDFKMSVFDNVIMLSLTVVPLLIILGIVLIGIINFIRFTLFGYPE